MTETLDKYDHATLAPWVVVGVIASTLCIASLVGLTAGPASGVVVLAIGLLAVLAVVSLRAAVLVYVCLLPFDIQRQVAGQWVYLDLSGLFLAVPLIRTGMPPRKAWMFVPYFVFFVISTVPRMIGPAWFYGYAVRWVTGLIVCFGVTASGVGEAALFALGLVALPVTAYGLYQLVARQFGDLFLFINPHMADMPWTDRAYSFFWQPNNLGGFCGIVTVALVGLAISGRRTRLYMLLASVAFIGVLLSGSRGALLGSGAGLLAVLSTKNFKRALVIAVGLMVAFASVAYTGILPLDRVTQVDELTAARLPLYGIAIVMFLGNPIIGVGTTNFSQIMPNLLSWRWDTVPSHDIYLQHLAENGLIGFLLFWVPVAILVRYAWKHRRDALMLACSGALIVFAVHGIFDYMFETAPQYLMLFFCVCGLVLGRMCYEAPALATSQSGVNPSLPL